MADKPLNPQGKSYGLAWCVAHPGKGDELEKLLVMAGQSGRSSELEPFCDEFRVFRFGDEFRLLEIFDETKGGVTEHQNSKAFNEVGSRTDIVASRGMRFYEEAFDWSFNDADLPVDTWKIMMYSEILDFHHIDNTAEAAEGPVAGTAHQQQAPAQ